MYVWLSLVLSCCPFSGLVRWLCQLPFLFPGVPSMSNTPKIISNLGETSRNGIPLGSFLEVFPALHSSFLFLPSSFQQEACVYVWLSLNLSCCLFSGLVGWLCQLPFLFPGVPSMSNTPRITSNLGVISRNGIPLGSFLEVFPALHVSFLFLQPSFSKKHVCMFGCHWFCHVLCIFWAGWVVVPNGIPLGSLLEAFPALHSSFLFLPSSFQQEACIYVLSAVVCGTLRGKWPIYLIEVNA